MAHGNLTESGQIVGQAGAAAAVRDMSAQSTPWRYGRRRSRRSPRLLR
jgi:hypothetical protein